MIYDLPKTLLVGGLEMKIRSDFRAVLDVISAVCDPNLTDWEKKTVVIDIIYESPLLISDEEEAIEQAMWFIAGGNNVVSNKKSPKLMDWEQDFKLIISPVNRVLGYECREKAYLHWWTFLSAYMEIGECTFSAVCGIRSKLAKHKTLEKYEEEYYRNNRELIDLKMKLSQDEQSEVDSILGL